jgi:hypothetical protein
MVVERWERLEMMVAGMVDTPMHSPRYSIKKQQVVNNNRDTDSMLDTSISSESLTINEEAR